MIEAKYYTEKEGRDPSIYLGIDGSEIPIELFKGIYSEDGVVYTDDPFYGIQFIVTEDEKSVLLITLNDNLYITKEDIESTDIWYKIGHALGEYSTQFMSIEESNKNSPHNILLKRYESGETGLLEYQEKKYNNKGEYMRIYNSFDTRPNPEDSDIRGNLLRHINFVYRGELIRWEEREMILKSNTNNLMQLIVLEVKPQIDVLISGGLLQMSEDQIRKIQYVMIPSMGKLQFEFDESIEDFLVIRKDK